MLRVSPRSIFLVNLSESLAEFYVQLFSYLEEGSSGMKVREKSWRCVLIPFIPFVFILFLWKFVKHLLPDFTLFEGHLQIHEGIGLFPHFTVSLPV